jgi:hypothetical protein
MKNIILILSTLTMVACSKGGSNNGGTSSRVDAALIASHDYETTDVVYYFQHLDYPGNNAVNVLLKGTGLCSGRVQLGGSTFTLFDFTGPCSVLNGDFAYYLTTTCQGYQQADFRCGDTSLIEIVVKRK